MTFDPVTQYSPLKETGLPSGQHQTVIFQTNSLRPNNQVPGAGQGALLVKIPTIGDFDVELVEEGRGARSDLDASDGYATIAIPKGTYDLYLSLQGNSQAVNFVESGYNQKDTLTKLGAPDRWYHVGKRALPIDPYWEIGVTHKLHFHTSEASQFTLRAYRTNCLPDYPPGISEVDSRGGVVNLPGVASLDVPPGALSTSTVVKIKQALIGKSVGSDFAYCAPMVNIEPTGTKFLLPAKLKFDIKDSIRENFIANSLLYFTSEDGNSWDQIPVNYDNADSSDCYVEVNHLSSFFVLHPLMESIRSVEKTAHFVYYFGDGVNRIAKPDFFKVFDRYAKESFEDAYKTYTDNYLSTGYPLPLGVPFYSTKEGVGAQTLIPIYLSNNPDTFGADYVTNAFFIHNRSVYTHINTSISVIPFDFIQKIYHETYHQFQYAAATEAKGPLGAIFINSQKWWLEGSARYIGTAMAYKARAQKSTLYPRRDDRDFLAGLSHNFDYSNELYANWIEMPHDLTLRSDPYSTSPLFATLAKQFGYKTLFDIAKEIPNSPSAEAGIDKVLKTHNSSLYACYRQMAEDVLDPEYYFDFPGWPQHESYTYATPSPIVSVPEDQSILSDAIPKLATYYYKISATPNSKIKLNFKDDAGLKVRYRKNKNSAFESVAPGSEMKVEESDDPLITVSFDAYQMPIFNEFRIEIVRTKSDNYSLVPESDVAIFNQALKIELRKASDDSAYTVVTPETIKISENQSGSTVDEHEYVAGFVPGQDTIEATYQGKTYKALVRVSQKALAVRPITIDLKKPGYPYQIFHGSVPAGALYSGEYRSYPTIYMDYYGGKLQPIYGKMFVLSAYTSEGVLLYETWSQNVMPWDGYTKGSGQLTYTSLPKISTSYY